MKLKKCYVSSFGKLVDYTYDFTDGVNTIKEDNGWGKSTLATFIKSMFYGLSGTSKRTVAENERLKYKPWNSTQTFGGYVQFVWGDKEYKLERYFGNKDSEDTVALTDMTTGKTYTNESGWGKRIFEIDEEGFLSTTYFSQKDFQAKSNTSITAKYNSICEIQDTEAFDNALERVENEAKKYKQRGEKGLIFDAKRELIAINEEIERITLAVNTTQKLKADKERLQNEVASLNSVAEKLTAEVTFAGQKQALKVKREMLDGLEKEYKDLVVEKEKIERSFAGKNYDEQTITSCDEWIKELSSINSTKVVVQEEVNNLEDKIKQEKEKKTNTKLTKKQKLIFILAAMFSIVGTIGFFVNTILSICGFALGAVFSILAYFSTTKEEAGGDLKIFEEMLEKNNNRLQDCLEKERVFIKKLDEAFDGVLFDGANDYLQKMDFIKKLTIVKDEIERKIQSVLQSIEKLKPEISSFTNDNEKESDLDALKIKLSEVRKEYSTKASELANAEASIKRYEEYVDKLGDLENKKIEIQEKQVEYKEKYDVLCLTAEYLKKADENLKVKYRAPLQNSLNKYLTLIDKNLDAKIDVDLNVSAIEKGGEKSTEYYSKGYQNLFEICKRFALTDVLFTGEKPFIILDDPFYNLDDEKLLAALKLVKDLSKEYQILYLICHESRRA